MDLAGFIRTCVLDPIDLYKTGRKNGQRSLALASAIEVFNRQCQSSYHNDAAPIFILASGWRSGSTLLQRAVMSGGKALIWGEPYGAYSLIESLAEPLRRFAVDIQSPPAAFVAAHQISQMAAYKEGLQADALTQAFSRSWVANLFPDLSDLRAAQSAFLDRLCAEPARCLGLAQWGIKEIRLTADHALYLRWLFPRAKILFLHRNPYDAFRSYAGATRRTRWWRIAAQDPPIRGAMSFGKCWSDRVHGFMRVHKDVGALLIRYEDLLHDQNLWHQLEEYLETSLNRDTLNQVISGVSDNTYELTRPDIWMLRTTAGKLADELGYSYVGESKPANFTACG